MGLVLDFVHTHQSFELRYCIRGASLSSVVISQQVGTSSSKYFRDARASHKFVYSTFCLVILCVSNGQEEDNPSWGSETFG